MKIIDFIKKLLTKEVTSNELISISDMLNIPCKKEISDESLIKEIEDNEKKYEELLNQKTYHDLSYHNLEEIRRKLDEILTIVIDIMMGSNLRSTLLKEEEPSRRLIEVKLALYRNEVIEKERDIFTKLIALKELQSKLFFSKKKKDNTRKEIDYLCGVYLVLKNVRTAIDLKIDAYIKEIELKGYSSYENRKIISYKILSAVWKEKLDYITSLNLDEVIELALVEKCLEESAFETKDKVNHLKDELNLVVTNQEIDRLENYYLLYAIYGRNIITEYEVSSFYRKKFDLITMDIGNIPNPFIDNTTNNIEKRCYLEKVTELCKKILKDKMYLETLKSNHFLYSEILKLVKKGIDNPEEILSNHLELCLFLSIVRKNGLEDLFIFYEVDLDAKEDEFLSSLLDKYKDIFTFTNKIPLATIMWLISLSQDKEHKIDDYKTNHLLFCYDLYNFLSLKQTNNYHLPQGLITADLSKNQYISFKKANQDIVCPSTLKVLKLDYCDKRNNCKIELNDELEELDIAVLTGFIVDLEIPSSLSSLKISRRVNEFQIGAIENIIFRDYQNSNIINNREVWQQFLKDNCLGVKTGQEHYHYPSEYALQKQKDYIAGCYSAVIDIDLLDYPCTMYEYKIVMQSNSFQNIIFLSPDKEPIIINIDDLNLTFWRSDYYYKPMGQENLITDNVNLIINKINEQINPEIVKKKKK